jgi:hypothetical protein
MAENSDVDDTLRKVMVHIYDSAVIGSINSISMMLRIRSTARRVDHNQGREDIANYMN